MYTPRRRSSVSEAVYRFTPSKRGQAALDAFALGYDVQLPDYSIALLPRSAASDHTLTSISTGSSGNTGQLPRSASYTDPSYRGTLVSSQGSNQQRYSVDSLDRRRLARQLHSPCREKILYSTSSTELTLESVDSRAESPSSVADSRPSTSSVLSDPPQYALASPERDRSFVGSNSQESPVNSTLPPRSLSESPTSSALARRHTIPYNNQSQLKCSETSVRHASVAQRASNVAESHGTESRGLLNVNLTHNHSARVSPIKPAPPPRTFAFDHALDRSSKAHPLLRIETDPSKQRGSEEVYGRSDVPYTRNRGTPSPLFSARPLHESEDRDLYSHQQCAMGTTQYRHSASGAHPALYHSSKLPTIEEPQFASFHNYASRETNPNIRRHSQRAQYVASLQLPSPIQSSTSAPSPRGFPTNLSHNGITQSLHYFPPSSSGKSASPRTPSSSLPSSVIGHEDEAFRVHPERAVVSRMESMLMLSACRYEAEGRWPAEGPSRSPAGYEIHGGAGHSLFPTGMSRYIVGSDPRVPQYSNYVTHGHDLGEQHVHTPSGLAQQFGLQAGPLSPNYSRSLGARARQRSGSMHVLSPQRHGPPRSGSPSRQRQPQIQPQQRPRPRQRSMSLTVQGLSSEAIKKLRVYETMKLREGGHAQSLREMVGVVLPLQKKLGTSKGGKMKKSGRSSQGSKAALSSPEAPTPVEPCSPTPLSLPLAPSSAPMAPCALPPASIPLPPSPHVLPLSPAQIALPPSPNRSPTLGFSSPVVKEPSAILSPLVSSESFMKYRVSQGIESPRPVRTRQNTAVGRVVPTFRLTSSPENTEQTGLGLLAESHLRGLEVLATRIDKLKPDPTIERIITPPPAFWSPPPSSAVRTSAPLLAAAGLASTRAPLRPMSVPPGAGESQVDEVRRAWSCEPPVNVDVRVGKSFAGDWSQCMVIDVSDEEDEEGDMVTDLSSTEDESELEDEVQAESSRDGYKCPDDLKQGERLSNVVDENERAGGVGYPRESGVAKYYLKEGPSLGSGSVNAVEAVQSAIVKLAMDNAGLARIQHPPVVQSRRQLVPPLSADPISRYPGRPYPQQKPPMDYAQYSQTRQMQASINAYFDPPSTYPRPHPKMTNQPTSNAALESLRSGLEQRVAASASAIEEAVRARSASPSLSHPIARSTAPRSFSGPVAPVLPPRLQRLNAAHGWSSPKIPLTRLDIPPFARTVSSSRHLVASSAPSPIVVQQQQPCSEPLVDDSARQQKLQPTVLPPLEESSPSSILGKSSSAPTTSAPKKKRPARPLDIVVAETLVPLAPATAPLSRPKRNRNNIRRSADGALPKKEDKFVVGTVDAPAISTSTTTPVTELFTEPATPSSSRPSGSTVASPSKPKWRGKYQHRKSKKAAAGAVPIDASSPPAPPAPCDNTPPASQDSASNTKAPKKKRNFKKYKTNKPSTGS